MQALENLIAQVRKLWEGASPLIRVLVSLGVLLVIGGVIYSVSVEASHDLVPLSEQPLSLQQVGRITTELEKRGVPYKVMDSGTQVLVPQKRRGDLLASLAGAGVSVRSERVKPPDNSLLATDFQQREHVRRELESSLSRDIAAMTAIEWAEVHISPGSDSVFSRSRRTGAASVVIKLRPGYSLPKEGATSLKLLVAQAAHRYGVTSRTVTVVDHEARLIAPAEEDGELGRNTRALALQRETEDDLAARIRTLLEPVVGMGRVRVQVRTKMDLNRVEEDAVEYDPDNATVNQERKTSEASNAQSTDPGQAAGTPSNIPQGNGGRPVVGRSRSSQDRVINETKFLVPSVTRRTKRAIGDIQRMSIAVLVDAAAFAAPRPDAGVDDDAPTIQPQTNSDTPLIDAGVVATLPPRPNRQMLLSLVRDAVAFDAQRGDTITLSFQRFVKGPDGPRARATADEPAWPAWIPVTIVTVAGFILIAVAWRMAERRRKQEELDAQAAEEAARAKEEKKQAEEPQPEELLRDQIRDVTREEVAATIEIIKGWLSTSPQKG